MEKLKNEKKEQQLQRAEHCFAMANHAQAFITKVHDTKGLYQMRGYKAEFNTNVFKSVDHGTFMFWSEREFLEKYNEAITLAKI